MDKKNRTILTVLAVLTLFIALLGATYAYFSATSKSEPQIITTSSLSLAVTLKGSTHVTNIKPTTWSTNMSNNESNVDIAKIPFKVSTSAGVKAYYDITMSTAIPSNTSLSGGNATDVKYKLFKSGETTALKEGNFSASFNEKIISDAPIEDGVELNDEYDLYVYIENKDEAQNTLQNIDFSINISGNAKQID